MANTVTFEFTENQAKSFEKTLDEIKTEYNYVPHTQ